ncbi:DUF6444 domain-containing protein, partial [Massilia genomosp. 1]|uniref:DUF6444 domain-containing protein n=1 Tax=Massilia genomosp. 1 TaxID=2609280 RepID=UPI001C9E9FF2
PEKDKLIEKLHAQVKEALAGKSIRKDSHNSSVPPSADGLKKKSNCSAATRLAQLDRQQMPGAVRPTCCDLVCVACQGRSGWCRN